MGSNSSLSIMDDPERLLNIRKDGDFRTFRSRGVAKEPWTYEWLKDFTSGTVLFDIGACVGTYSLMAAARGATVYAFEPLPVNYAELSYNIILNKLTRKIAAIPIAASDHTHWMKLNAHQDGLIRPGYGLASTEKKEKMTVGLRVWAEPLQALPDELIKPPTHIKVDVEGGEVAALRGCAAFLPEVTSVIVEIHDDDTEEEVSEIMGAAQLFGEEVNAPDEERRRTNDERTLIYARD